ncbi:MAG: cytochrome c biogenesis protein [Candidatus Kapaibacterium sp.]
MKFLLYVVGLGGAIALGVFPRPQVRRPLLTRILTVALVVAVTFLTFLPPLVGTFGDAIMNRERHAAQPKVNVLVRPDLGSVDSLLTIAYAEPGAPVPLVLRFASTEVLDRARACDPSALMLVTVTNEGDHRRFLVHAVLGTKPLLILPYIPALEERSRIMFLHVPMSWVGFLAFIVTLWYSVSYLRRENPDHDLMAAASAGIGLLFCSLAYVTGALWAKFNWGKFFNWDMREFSVLVLLLIYGAYFVLRSSMPESARRSRISGVYAIVSCVAALFLLFIVPRMTESLHPGSQSDTNAGPILSTQADAINITKAYIFSLSLAAFTLLYFWMLNLSIRLRSAENAMRERMR